jgi:hypothetical protein
VSGGGGVSWQGVEVDWTRGEWGVGAVPGSVSTSVLGVEYKALAAEVLSVEFVPQV